MMQRNTVLSDSKLPVVFTDGQGASTDVPRHCGLFTNKSEVDSVPLLYSFTGKS